MFTYYLCVLMAHASSCLHVFGFSITNITKRTKRSHNQNRFHNSFEGQNMAGYDLRRLSLSQAPCLERVFRHQIASLLFYRGGFIVNGCRFTCQTMPPFTICNLLAFPLPTWLQRSRPTRRAKQKRFGSCVHAEVLFDSSGRIILACDSLGRL